MAFNWWDSFYGSYIGIQIRGQLGKRYIYRILNTRQMKQRYNVQHNLSHPNVIRTNENFRKAMDSWKSLSPPQQEYWKGQDQYSPPMSGFNYFLSLYLQRYFT